MKEPEYYDADRWGIFSDNYEEKTKKNNVQLNCYDAEELLKAYTQNMPFLWGNILPKTGLVCFAGESDCGKSAFLRQLAIFNCSYRTGNFLGLKFENDNWRKKSLYISTEDDQHYFAAVLRKQCKELKIEPNQISGLKVIFENDNIIEKIELFQKREHTNLIIIDCLNDILPTQATSAVAIRKFLSKLQRIAEDHQCLIILTHHTNKYARNRRPSKYNLIGSPALEAKCRTVIELRTDPFQRNLKHLCVVKGNYTPDEVKDKSYMLEFTPQLTFKNTGRRVDIDTLTLMPDHIADRVEKYNRKKYIKTNNEPTKPTESTQITELPDTTEITNTSAPVELTNTTAPVELTNTNASVESTQPVESNESYVSTKLSEPKESSGSTDPTDPSGQSFQSFSP